MKINRLIHSDELDENVLEYFLSFIEFKDMKYHIQKWDIDYFMTIKNLATLTKRVGMRNIYPEGVDLNTNKMNDIKRVLIHSILAIKFPSIESRLITQDMLGVTLIESKDYISYKKALSLKDINFIYKEWEEVSNSLHENKKSDD